MTHQKHSNNLDHAVHLLSENGFDGMAHAIQILMKEAMLLERNE